MILKAMVMVNVNLLGPLSRVSAMANFRGSTLYVHMPMHVLKNWTKERHFISELICKTDTTENWKIRFVGTDP